MYTLRRYAKFVGLRINLDKSAFLLRGFWTDRQKTKLENTGIPVQSKVKYLGNLFGDVTPDEAFAPHLSRALARAQFAATLPLTMPERVHLLQEWILPLMIYPARAYFPTEDVCTKLANVYRVALRLGSWGLTLPILQLPPKLGGALLPKPSLFLHQNSSGQGSHASNSAHRTCRRDCRPHGPRGTRPSWDRPGPDHR